jgi:hypothetical protein
MTRHRCGTYVARTAREHPDQREPGATAPPLTCTGAKERATVIETA